MRKPRILIAGILITAGLVACSDTDSKDLSTTSSVVNTPSVKDYVETGPHHVGVATLELANGSGIEVWYPTSVPPEGEVAYDVRDFVPDSIKALLTADIPASFAISATRDAEIESGVFPVVLFSHGFSGMRLQSSFLTSHLASWGMIVISPDHESRDLRHAFVGQIGDSATAITDLFDALELVHLDKRFANAMEMDSIAAVGHSAGGGTVLKAASDERVDGYVSLASGRLGNDTETAMPDKPSFFIAGSLDQVVSAASATQPAFDAAPTPSVYWLIDGVGHNGFDDFCTFGNGKGIIGVAEASGLGAVLDAQPQFKKLGSDGCLPPSVSAEVGFPIIRSAVTAWLLGLFTAGGDNSSVTAPQTDNFETNITIQSR